VCAITIGAVLVAAHASCGASQRALRVGVQRDAAGRPFLEMKTMSLVGCEDPTTGNIPEADVRSRLNASAQDQGYSGVIEVTCAAGGGGQCAVGVTCAGIAVRYVIPSAGGEIAGATPGASCEPPCAGTARCQEGQCVPACLPLCGVGSVCVQSGTCDSVR
jgi:hypothetical protein